MKEHIIKFIKKSMMFLLIFIVLTSLILFIPTYVFLSSKEHISLEKVIISQNSNDVLFGKAYTNEQSLYKLMLVNNNDCEIISLGTSRVMQFRDHFFTKKFCNLGGGIYNIYDARKFLDRVDKDKLPKLIMLGLDQNFFNERWTDSRQDFKEIDNYLLFIPQNTIKIYQDVFNSRIDFRKFRSEDKNIGLNAIMNENGFINDGSYLYTEIITKNESVENRVADTLNLIKHGSGRFVKNVGFDPDSLDELRKVLNFCKEKNIQVIGFLPPFSKEVWIEINNHKNEYLYMFEIVNRTKPLFEEYGYEFYDYTDLNTINSSNCEITDGFHGSEKAYLRILIDINKKSEHLKEYVDFDLLEQKLELTKGCFTTPEIVMNSNIDLFTSLNSNWTPPRPADIYTHFDRNLLT